MCRLLARYCGASSGTDGAVVVCGGSGFGGGAGLALGAAGFDPSAGLPLPFAGISFTSSIFGAGFFVPFAGVPFAGVPFAGVPLADVLRGLDCAGGLPAGLVPGAAGVLAVPAGGTAASFGSTAGLSGTEGRRWARISAARARTVTSVAAGRSCFSSTTRTSSNLLRLAVGFTLILRNKSFPLPTFATVPTGNPLGKI